MPSMGFFNTLRHLLIQLIFGVLGAVLTGAIAYVLIAYGIPMLLELALDG